MTPCFTARADARRNTCLSASENGSRPAISNCIRARHGSCTARTSIGPRRIPTSSSPFSATRSDPARRGQVWPRLCELLAGGQPRRAQGHAADNPGMAGPTEERQEPGRSFGHARTDLEGMATILRPFPRLGAQVGLAACEPILDRMVDAEAQEAGGPQNACRRDAQTAGATSARRIGPLVDGLSVVGWMMGAG